MGDRLKGLPHNILICFFNKENFLSTEENLKIIVFWGR